MVQSKAQSRGFCRDFLLWWNVIIVTPHHSMLIWIILMACSMHLIPISVPFILAYVVFCLLDSTPAKGGWSFVREEWRSWARDFFFFRWFAEFFEMDLIKTAELDTSRRYIFAMHPHGIIGMTFNGALTTNGAGFERLFPGIERVAVTLNGTFLAPIFREWLLFLGFVSADRATLISQLKHKSIAMVPGGAAEALYAHPGTMTLVLRKRFGFIKVAMQSGAPIVPCLGFGENDIFNTISPAARSKSRKLPLSTWERFVWDSQVAFKNTFTVSTPMITNVIPNRVKTAVVVGAPVEMDREKSVEENHAKYLEALTNLYNEHKGKHGYGNVELEIV